MISSILGYLEGIYGTFLVYTVPFVMIFESVRTNSINRKVYNASVAITIVIIIIHFLHFNSWSISSTSLALKYIIGTLLVGCSVFYIKPSLLERKMKVLLLILFVSCLPLFFVEKYDLLIISGAIHKKLGLFGIPEMRGLLFNSNYLSICGIALGGYFLGKKELSIKWFILSALVCVFGGSRSGLLILLLLIAIEFSSLRLLLILISLGMLAVNNNTALLLFNIFSERGYTGRESLFENAITLIGQNIWLGVGYDYGDILLDMGSFTSTVQNTLLSNTLKYGVLISSIEFIVSLVVLHRLFKRQDDFRYIFLVIMIDSLFRTYSFGGIGMLSYLYTFIMLRELVKNKNISYA